MVSVLPSVGAAGPIDQSRGSAYLVGLLAGLLITHMLIFDAIGLVVNAGRSTDDLSFAAANKELGGAALLLGRTRTALLIALVLSVFVIRVRQRSAEPPYRPVAFAFVAYWIGALLIPAFVAGEFTRVYAYTYPLMTGLVIATINSAGRRAFFSVFVWTVFLATVLSLIVFAVAPRAVSELDYEDAVFGAFPRFQGFTIQANALGAILAPWLLILVRWPLRPSWVNRIAWIAGILALLASQSKTSIVGFAVAGCWMLLRAGDGQTRRLILAALPPLILGVAGTFLLILSMDLVPSLSRDALRSVTTVTGRSLIWSLALDAWQSHPWLGYGPQLFRDGAFDSYPEVARTVHAHNQVIDTMGRAGLLGLASLLALLVTLAIGISRLAGTDRALGVALFLLLTVQSLSETPMGLSIGPLNVSYWMLMALVASQASGPPSVNVEPAR